MYWKTTKIFYDSNDGLQEIVGYFNSYLKANQCKIIGPKYSMDDPNLFYIEISSCSNIPDDWEYEVDESIWGKF
jgi:hypothetical protein